MVLQKHYCLPQPKVHPLVFPNLYLFCETKLGEILKIALIAFLCNYNV